MASEEKRLLLQALSPTLKAHGFRKKDSTWRRTRDGFIQIINVQGSQWSRSFYLNLGIYIEAIGAKATPLEFDCHIRNRADNLVEDHRQYQQLLDFEVSISPEVRFRELNEIIEKRVIPWLDEFSTDQRIRDWITDGQEQDLGVVKKVFEYYGMER